VAILQVSISRARLQAVWCLPAFRSSGLWPESCTGLFSPKFPTLFQANSKTNMKLNTYLNFDGNCEEALKFYEKALGAKPVMMMCYGMPVDQFGVPWIVNCEKKA
jgi:hypothetical protein